MKALIRKAVAHAVARMPRGPLIDPDHYNIFQRRGLHVLPVHFYSSLPNTLELDHSMWDKPTEMTGVEQRLPEQVQLLTDICETGLMAEYHEFPWETSTAAEYSRNGGFGEFDGAILYSMIRKFKPKKIIEIGAGASTLLSKLALSKNGSPHSLTAIDPYPADYLKHRTDIEVVAKKVEEIPLSTFTALEENDILFIDSSHTVRIGGDVLFEVLEILPNLKKGVIVHIHDIFLPMHYPKEWVLKRHSSWTEQYLIQAFLAFNTHFQILWGFNMMAAAHPDVLKHKYDNGMQLNGSSLWLRKIA